MNTTDLEKKRNEVMTIMFEWLFAPHVLEPRFAARGSGTPSPSARQRFCPARHWKMCVVRANREQPNKTIPSRI